MAKNKPIMIDRVDVSECIFYQANFEEDFDVKIKHFCSNWHNSCESVNNSSCNYKQLKRKEQECEELKGRLKYIREENKYLKEMALENIENNPEKHLEEYTELLQQLDQLKAELQEYQDWFDEFKLMFRYDDREPDDNSELYSCLESVVDENKKLRQAEQKLEKIRQVCTETKDVGENINDMYTAKLSGLYLKSRQILQIIDEVE